MKKSILFFAAALALVSCNEKKEQSFNFAQTATVEVLPNCPVGYVDLGLKNSEGEPVFWAVANLQYSFYEDGTPVSNTVSTVGDYFAWGEVEPKDNYSLDLSYRWWDYKYSTYTRYPMKSKTSTDPVWFTLRDYDDAARETYNGYFRMPTKKEFSQLLDECKWFWTTVDGVAGYAVVGPNDNALFLPAAGSMSASRRSSYGTVASYWAVDLADPETDGSYPYAVCFAANKDVKRLGFALRYEGHLIRPVYDQNYVPED